MKKLSLYWTNIYLLNGCPAALYPAHAAFILHDKGEWKYLPLFYHVHLFYNFNDLRRRIQRSLAVKCHLFQFCNYCLECIHNCNILIDIISDDTALTKLQCICKILWFHQPYELIVSMSSMKKVLWHSCNCIHFIYLFFCTCSLSPIILNHSKVIQNRINRDHQT